jgi:hypothetical protein
MASGYELTYLLLPSVPPDKPPIFPKSIKGTAPPETCGKNHCPGLAGLVLNLSDPPPGKIKVLSDHAVL